MLSAFAMPDISPQIIVIAAAAALLILAARLHDRTHTAEDFLCARRRVSPRIGELSLAFTQVPPWLLLAVAMLAYQSGATATWVALAVWLGVAIGAIWIGPRVRKRAVAQNSYTLARLIDPDSGELLRKPIRRSIAGLVVLCLSLSIGVQLTWLTTQLASLVDTPQWLMLACGAGTLLLCGLLGGLWAAAVTDAILAVAMLGIGMIVAMAAFGAQGWSLPPLPLDGGELTRPAWQSQVLSSAFAVGISFLIGSAFTQPAALSRYFAQHVDERPRFPWLLLFWSMLALSVALLLGWSARLQHDFADLPTLLTRWLPKKSAGQLWTALLCAGVGAQLSNCVAMASHFAHDWIGAREVPLSTQSLTRYRWGLAICIAAACALSFATGSEFDTLWFEWHALGAAFAPLLLVRLSGKSVRPGSTLGSIWAGFALTTIFHAMPDTPGDLLERGLPFIVALGIALSGGERRRNPDRADRGERTVHDHLPI